MSYICGIQNVKTHKMSYFTNIKTTRINTGIYQIVREGRTFEAEKSHDGQWKLSERKSLAHLGLGFEMEYLDHYVNLQSCKILINDYFAEIH